MWGFADGKFVAVTPVGDTLLNHRQIKERFEIPNGKFYSFRIPSTDRTIFLASGEPQERVQRAVEYGPFNDMAAPPAGFAAMDIGPAQGSKKAYIYNNQILYCLLDDLAGYLDADFGDEDEIADRAKTVRKIGQNIRNVYTLMESLKLKAETVLITEILTRSRGGLNEGFEGSWNLKGLTQAGAYYSDTSALVAAIPTITNNDEFLQGSDWNYQ